MLRDWKKEAVSSAGLIDESSGRAPTSRKNSPLVPPMPPAPASVLPMSRLNDPSGALTVRMPAFPPSDAAATLTEPPGEHADAAGIGRENHLARIGVARLVVESLRRSAHAEVAADEEVAAGGADREHAAGQDDVVAGRYAEALQGEARAEAACDGGDTARVIQSQRPARDDGLRSALGTCDERSRRGEIPLHGKPARSPGPGCHPARSWPLLRIGRCSPGSRRW